MSRMRYTSVTVGVDALDAYNIQRIFDMQHTKLTYHTTYPTAEIGINSGRDVEKDVRVLLRYP